MSQAGEHWEVPELVLGPLLISAHLVLLGAVGSVNWEKMHNLKVENYVLFADKLRT